MAIRTSYFNDGQTVYQAGDFMALNKAAITNGVIGPGDMLVKPVSPAAMQVAISMGTLHKDGHTIVMDADTTVDITANTSGYNRIDAIVIEVDDATNTTTAKAIAGTPSSSPARPTITSKQEVLAYVTVGNNASVINANAISDARKQAATRLATNPNLLINGGFDFWQRGTNPFSVGATTTYTADRWAAYAIGGGTATVAKQDAGVLSLTGKYAFLVQAVEPLPSFDRSKPYTFSIDLKRDSGNTGVQMGIALKDTISGDWIYQDQINAMIGINEWNRVSITSSGLEQYTANYLMVYIKVNAPSGGTIYARRAKLEQGNVATPYVPRPYGLEKDLCRRYYQKSEHGVASTYGITTSSTTLQVWFKFDVYMRTKPTVVLFEPGWGAEWHIWRIDQMGRDGFNRVDEMDYTKEGFDKFILGNAVENVPGYWWYYTADAEIY